MPVQMLAFVLKAQLRASCTNVLHAPMHPLAYAGARLCTQSTSQSIIHQCAACAHAPMHPLAMQVLAFVLKAHLRAGRTRANPADPSAFKDDPTCVA